MYGDETKHFHDNTKENITVIIMHKRVPPTLACRYIYMDQIRSERDQQEASALMAFKINLSKNMNKISVCNYDALQKIFRAEPCKTESDEPRKKNQEGECEWRSMPTCNMEMMLISSYGDEFIPLLDAVPKLLDNAVEASERLILARKELDAILDKCRVDDGVMLKYFCTDFPGAQFPKYYYIDRVKKFFEQSDKDGGRFISVVINQVIHSGIFFPPLS